MRTGSDGYRVHRAHAALCPAMSEGTSSPLPRPFLKCHPAQWHPLYCSEGFEAPEVAHPCQQKPKAQILVKQKNVVPWGSSARHLTQGSIGAPGANAGSSDFLQDVSFG